MGVSVKRFRYGRDSLCLGALSLYALNRWVLKALMVSSFLSGQFNDVLLIPAALPLVLWVQRGLRIRKHDRPPAWSEIGLHFLVWSVVCEGIGPWWFHHGTSDPWDVIAYAMGAGAAGFWWNQPAFGGERGNEED